MAGLSLRELHELVEAEEALAQAEAHACDLMEGALSETGEQRRRRLREQQRRQPHAARRSPALPTKQLVALSEALSEASAGARSAAAPVVRLNRAAELRRLLTNDTTTVAAAGWNVVSTARHHRAGSPPAKPYSTDAAPHSVEADASCCLLHVRGIGTEYQNSLGIGKYERESELRRIFSRYGEVVSAAVRHRIDEDGSNTSW
jgi:hypothetical protein